MTIYTILQTVMEIDQLKIDLQHWNFKCFYKQDQALRYSHNVPGTRVFSYEIDQSGRRRFLVSRIEKFWDFYWTSYPKNFYEVIDNETKYLKLFFDLEFLCNLNPDKDGHLMTKILICKVNNLLSTKFSKSDFEDVLILDASSCEKFSNHLIFSIGCFHGISDIRRFVINLLETCNESEKELFNVKTRRGSGNFIDLREGSHNKF